MCAMISLKRPFLELHGDHMSQAYSCNVHHGMFTLHLERAPDLNACLKIGN